MGITGRRVATVAVAMCLVVPTAACSGDDDDSTTVITDPVQTTETTEASTSSTTAAEDPDAAVKAEVEAAYLAYWDAVPQFFNPPDPEHPLIELHTAEAVREATLSGISQLILDGESIRRPDNEDHFIVTILDVDPMVGRAGVRACIVDGLQVVKTDSGQVINGNVVTKTVQAEVVRDGSRWKVAQSRLVESADGVHECE